MATIEVPRIVLYTNHACPWAQRAHIALSALGLPYEESIIDLDTPRTAEYLEINPRGLVPTLNYDGVIIPESGIVSQFLADAYPKSPSGVTLLPPSNTIIGALQRAQITFFVDAFTSKVIPNFYAGLRAKSDDERTEAADKLVAAVVKELEPLLSSAGPYFGGSSEIGLAEVNTGSFLLRILSHGAHGLGAADLNKNLQKQAPAFWKWAQAVIKNEHVLGIWNEADVIERTKRKWGSKV